MELNTEESKVTAVIVYVVGSVALQVGDNDTVEKIQERALGALMPSDLKFTIEFRPHDKD